MNPSWTSPLTISWSWLISSCPFAWSALPPSFLFTLASPSINLLISACCIQWTIWHATCIFWEGRVANVELTACFHEEAISVQFQEWGVFAVKHTTAKKRGHLKDKNGNPVGQAWHYTFLLKEVDHAVPFMNQVIDSNLFMKENSRIGAYTMKSGLASFHAVKDLLYIDKSFTSAASPQEHQILLDMAPPPLHQASKGVELLNYGEFPPLQAPPLQGPLWSCN